MDHLYIDENDIASRYATGKLTVEERRAFEEHFVDCAKCQDQLDLVEELRSGLRDVATRDSISEPAGVHDGPHWKTVPLALLQTARFRSYRRAAVLAACLFLALPTALVWQIARLRQELELARLSAANRERLYQQEARTTQAQLDKSQAAGAAIFLLNTTRSADPGAEPENRIAVTPAVNWIALALQRDYEPVYQNYRVTLSDRADRTIWQQDHLVPSVPSSLGIVLPSAIFQAGDYLLKLEGATSAGRYFSLARYPIRVSAKN